MSIVAVKERPILFKGPLVRAILDGRKTVTRRPVDPQPWYGSRVPGGPHWIWPPGSGRRFDGEAEQLGVQLAPFCPYGVPGDRLWVRETWCHKNEDGCPVYRPDGELDSSCCWYAADGQDVRKVDGDGFTEFNKDGTEASPWKPSIHMPRWASRITLEITAVRVERVQEITAVDLRAEGVAQDGTSVQCWNTAEKSSRAEFSKSWDAIYEKRGLGWNVNPWVWVVEFRRI